MAKKSNKKTTQATNESVSNTTVDTIQPVSDVTVQPVSDIATQPVLVETVQPVSNTDVQSTPVSNTETRSESISKKQIQIVDRSNKPVNLNKVLVKGAPCVDDVTIADKSKESVENITDSAKKTNDTDEKPIKSEKPSDKHEYTREERLEYLSGVLSDLYDQIGKEKVVTTKMLNLLKVICATFKLKSFDKDEKLSKLFTTYSIWMCKFFNIIKEISRDVSLKYMNDQSFASSYVLGSKYYEDSKQPFTFFLLSMFVYHDDPDFTQKRLAKCPFFLGESNIFVILRQIHYRLNFFIQEMEYIFVNRPSDTTISKFCYDIYVDLCDAREQLGKFILDMLNDLSSISLYKKDIEDLKKSDWYNSLRNSPTIISKSEVFPKAKNPVKSERVSNRDADFFDEPVTVSKKSKKKKETKVPVPEPEPVPAPVVEQTPESSVEQTPEFNPYTIIKKVFLNPNLVFVDQFSQVLVNSKGVYSLEIIRNDILESKYVTTDLVTIIDDKLVNVVNQK